MEYDEKTLKNYVELVVKAGVNVQKGQNLLITCPVDCAYFARLAAEAAYKAGAREVFMRWADSAMGRISYLMADDAVFDEFPEWEALMYEKLSKNEAAFLSVSAADPEALLGVETSRITRFQKAMAESIKAYRRRAMNNENQWSVISVPTTAWAKKVFPASKDDAEARAKLWSAIFAASHALGQNPTEDWVKHSDNLKKNVKKLNDYNFKSLHLKNSIGTDLTVDLVPNHVWEGGAAQCRTNGVWFSPNIPTEEIYTAPRKTGVNGIVKSSRPFVRNGNIIENFTVEFKDGKVVNHSAAKGVEILTALLDGLDNARFLGEIALVPHRSPISETNLLFYNILYDENAACHLAFGAAYPDTIKNGGDMSEGQLEAAEMNRSHEHSDFMVGSSDMSIIGTTFSNQNIPVFANGSFDANF